MCTGLNRSGVALAQLSAMSRDRTLKGMPAAMRFRLGLEAGAAALETAAIIQALPGTIGNNLMLCDPREALVLELSARSGAWRRPQDGLLTVTNHYQSAAMQPLKGRFPPPPPGSVLSAKHFTKAYSAARNRRLQELVADRRLRPLDLQQILADHLITTAVIGEGLNHISESALVAFINPNKTKRLQRAGERRQHLRRAQHRARVRQEHQLDARALIQRAGQVQQSAGDGNDLQLAANAAAGLEAKDGRGRLGKLHSRRSPLRCGLQEWSHPPPIMFPC